MLEAGAGHLAHGFTHGPQPGRVNVGVPNGRDLVGAGVGRLRQNLRELGAGRGSRAGNVGEGHGVERAFQGVQDVPAAGVAQIQLVLELVEHLEVLDQLPHLGVEDVDVRPGHGVARGVPGREFFAQLVGMKGLW